MKNFGLGIIFAVVYFFTAKFSLDISAIGGVAAPVWPPTGIALFVLLVFGLRFWPSIMIGAFFVNLIATHQWLPSFLISIGNSLEAVVAVNLLRRFGFHRSLERIKDVILLLGIGALGSTLISSTFGVLVGSFFNIIPAPQLFQAWSSWWIGDMMGNLIVAPLLFVWGTRFQIPSPNKLIEAILNMMILLGLCLMIFIRSPDSVLGSNIFRPYTLFPLLIWITYRHLQRGATLAIFSISIIAISSTVSGLGPYAKQIMTNDLFSLQVFLGIFSFTFLFFAAGMKERQKSELKLKKAIKDRDDIVAVVSHDLKNPLNSIILNLQLIGEETGKPAFMRLDRIKRAAEKMQQLAHDILDITKIEAGAMTVELHREDAQNLLNESIELLRPLAEAKSIQLDSEFVSLNFSILCDHERILQVLSNLISNAIRFTPEQGKIHVSVREDSGFAHFTVRDSGPGISREDLPHVFDRFWQAKKAGKHSIGLGLSIAKAIVDAHGGRIWAESSVNEGAIFHFLIPVSHSDSLKFKTS